MGNFETSNTAGKQDSELEGAPLVCGGEAAEADVSVEILPSTLPKTSPDPEAALHQIESLVRGVLLNEGIHDRHPEREDLSQTLMLYVLDWQVRYPERELALWRGYLFTLLCWRTKNLLAKERRHSGRNASFETLLENGADGERHAALPGQLFSGEETAETAETAALLQKLADKLNEKEQLVLELSLLDWPVARIAQELRVSRQSVYRWRKQVQEKYKKIAGKDP